MSDPSKGSLPITRQAHARLVDEENRLFGAAQEPAGAGSAGGAADWAIVAAESHGIDAAERRIESLRDAIASAEIADAPDRAVIGRRVRVIDEDVSDTYRLVIPGAGDPRNGAISIDSPLGAAVLGAGPGDRIEYQAPAGLRTVTVTAVEGEEPPF